MNESNVQDEYTRGYYIGYKRGKEEATSAKAVLAPISTRKQIIPVCPKCSSSVSVFQSDIIHRCNSVKCQWSGKPFNITGVPQ